ncbi:DUF2911 domain-containing protein [Flavobacterium sp. WC2509]|uniref:DUF2911 domain-containing protein n=1 Tax=Flavobacterium sp. WC2509 TaxID=3461406 RepID=UPI004044F26B
MKILKITSLVIFTLFAISFANAQEKPKSPAEKVTGTINGASIEINYGSPSVRGRKIWGELVPFDKVWRAGANDATTFETNKDLTIEGAKLPAGKYSFFVIPNEKECVIIFNKEAKQWGAFKYKDTEDQLRVKVKPQVASSSVEKLVYSINSNNITLSWDTWNIGFKVK